MKENSLDARPYMTYSSVRISHNNYGEGTEKR